MKRSLTVLFLAAVALSTPASADSIFRSVDPLAARDEWGILHQIPATNPTDFERRRFTARLPYNLLSRRELVTDPAYVGALQVALQRNGYYCGPIDGVFSSDVVEAITRLQKNYSMRVTGNLTVPVRRALHLP
ncbi:MAG TPA: peptidoglycan-binding domain-containing protein [Chthoniobacterales bacterium]|nr:peptidoglycan-binding domain-containing protein [Chthoniobacterales bacterium]